MGPKHFATHLIQQGIDAGPSTFGAKHLWFVLCRLLCLHFDNFKQLWHIVKSPFASSFFGNFQLSIIFLLFVFLPLFLLLFAIVGFLNVATQHHYISVTHVLPVDLFVHDAFSSFSFLAFLCGRRLFFISVLSFPLFVSVEKDGGDLGPRTFADPAPHFFLSVPLVPVDDVVHADMVAVEDWNLIVAFCTLHF